MKKRESWNIVKKRKNKQDTTWIVNNKTKDETIEIVLQPIKSLLFQ